MSYEPTGFALEIFHSRHAAYAPDGDKPGEPWVDGCKRVAWHVADAEQGQDRVKRFEEFRAALVENRFMPGGRIWYGSGRARGQLLNCFVIPTSDSREGWGKVLYDTMVIAGTGGGIGANFGPIRGRGSLIRGTGGMSTGAVSLMSMQNGQGDEIAAGGGRRIALMQCLPLNHPDIVEFLNKKLDLKQLNNANVSVVFDFDPEWFFELVKINGDLPLMFQGKQISSISAHDIWMRIVRNALKGGEPGLLNLHFANKMSNIGYIEALTSTNPCITGDTLVAVADGRNAVSIKQLAEEGKDVPVYSVHPGTGETQIKMGINPRVTGRSSEVWKLTLDDGSTVRATPNHKFMLRDGSYKELRELVPGDSLMLKTKWQTSLNELFQNLNSRSSDYWMISGARGMKNRFEHTLIAEHMGQRVLQNGEVVHHRDFNSLNNSSENLQVMSKEDHDAYHASLITGENNPYHRMSDEWKQSFAKHDGPDNGMYGRENKWGNHTNEAKQKIALAHIGMIASDESREKMSAARTAYYDKKYESAGVPRTVAKTCPNPECNSEFTVSWLGREQMYCSKQCFLVVYNRRAAVCGAKKQGWADKRIAKRDGLMKAVRDLQFKLGHAPMESEFRAHCKEIGISSRFTKHVFKNYSDLKAAAADYNHRVVSVEFDGHEDVYNITVEDNHNFALAINSTETSSGKVKQNWLVTKQCGEIFMSPYDCCCLGHVVLPRFVVDGEFDWNGFKATIHTGVRFLDDVLTVNSYPLPEIKAKCGQLRRIGLGVLGLHHMLIELGMKYNSAKGLEFVDKLFKFLKNESYEASINLAIEKGPFPGFEADKYLKSAFVKTLKPSIRERIKQHGIRNCALNTIAPTGTISMVCEVSSGIEPIFAMAYERRYRKGEEQAMEIVADPLFKRYVTEGKSTKNFQNSYDLSMRDHLEMQRICQKHVDNAVSKTINLPPGTTEEELSDLFMEFIPELKGVTVYPVGSRENQPLTPLSADVAEQLVMDAIIQAGGNDSCRTGACDV